MILGSSRNPGVGSELSPLEAEADSSHGVRGGSGHLVLCLHGLEQLLLLLDGVCGFFYWLRVDSSCREKKCESKSTRQIILYSNLCILLYMSNHADGYKDITGTG